MTEYALAKKVQFEKSALYIVILLQYKLQLNFNFFHSYFACSTANIVNF